MTCRLPFLNQRRRWGTFALLLLQLPGPLALLAQEGRISEPLNASGNYQPNVRVANSIPNQNPGPTPTYYQPANVPAVGVPAATMPAAAPIGTAQPQPAVMLLPSSFAAGGYPPGTQFMLIPVPTQGMPVPTLPPTAHLPVVPTSTAATNPTPASSPAQPASLSVSPQQLLGLSQQVGRITAQGFQLAERGALFAAREKFEEALQLAAQGVDGQTGSNQHGTALAVAWMAFKEAQDFAPAGNVALVDRDVARIAATHRTEVLKAAPPGMPPVAALQAYYRYGRQQTVVATGLIPTAADALHGLGKVHSFLAREESETNELHIARAMACQQAALDINPQHGKAANELGVLLAQHGQWQDAKQALVHSLRVQPRPETWQNLAVVHQKLGETDLAQRAQWEHSRMLGPSNVPGANSSGVQWVEPEQFARQSPHPNAPGQGTSGPLPAVTYGPRPGTAPTANYPTPAGIHYR